MGLGQLNESRMSYIQRHMDITISQTEQFEDKEACRANISCSKHRNSTSWSHWFLGIKLTAA